LGVFAPKPPAVDAGYAQVNVLQHIGIQAGPAKNINIQRGAYDSYRPVPDAINRREVNAQQAGNYTYYFDPGGLVPPVLQGVDYLHRSNITM
jgi:hypothetical protein